MRLPDIGQRPHAGEDVVIISGFLEVAAFLLVELLEPALQLRFADVHRVLMQPQPYPVHTRILCQDIVQRRMQDLDIRGMRGVGDHRAAYDRLGRHYRGEFWRVDAEFEADGHLNAARMGHFDDVAHQRVRLGVAVLVGGRGNGARRAERLRAGGGAHSVPVPNAKSRMGMGRYPQRAVSDVSNPASGTTLRYSMRMIGSTYGAYRSAPPV